MQLGKEKYQTSVVKEQRNPEWGEECELTLHGMDGVIVLNAYHKSTLVEEFLGRLDLPLSKFNRYDPPRSQWYRLVAKPGKANTKDRGELEVEIGFVAKAKEEEKGTGSRKSGNRLIRSVTEAVGAVRSSIHIKSRSVGSGPVELLRKASDVNLSVEDILKELGEDFDLDDDDTSTPSRASGSLTHLERSGSYSGGSPKQQERRLSGSGVRVHPNRPTSAGSSPVTNRYSRSSSFPETDDLMDGTASTLTNGTNSAVVLREPKTEVRQDKSKRRHSIHSMTGSILSFAASKLRGESSTKHSISEETGDEYESLNHQELLKVAIQLRDTLKQKEHELIETRCYLDELVLLVMEKAPHLLEQGKPSRGSMGCIAVNSTNGVNSKSARKRAAWQM